MSDQDQNDKSTDDTNKPTTDNKDQEVVEKIVKERLDAQLKEIKDKLDSAFKQRDEALKKAAEFEQKEKEAQRKQLEEQGKFKELYELHLAEEKAKVTALEKKNTELARDVSVRDALKSLPFRNDNASEMAYKEIVGQLIRNDQGDWTHKSGVSVKDFVEVFKKDENNSFLFKAKPSTGSGSGEIAPTSSSTKPKSLFEMTQAEVLELASKGLLPKRGR